MISMRPRWANSSSIISTGTCGRVAERRRGRRIDATIIRSQTPWLARNSGGSSRKASLVHLRDVLGLRPAQLAIYISKMIERSAPKWPAVVASLSEFASYSAADKELGGIRRTAKVQTDWLDSPQIRADLKGGTFGFASVKERGTTVDGVLRRG